MIHPDNTILITSTISNNSRSKKRINNLIENFSEYNIPIVVNDYIKKDKTIVEISCELIINAIKLYRRTDYEYAIICEDDYHPATNLLTELNKTVNLLPDDWRVLHLCPGYLWGRKYKDKTKIGQLNPEYDMSDVPYDSSKRYYNKCNRDLYTQNRFWLGGPVSMLVNRSNVHSLYSNFIHACNDRDNSDVVLTKILSEDDYVCREPLLGYENDQGGSTF